MSSLPALVLCYNTSDEQIIRWLYGGTRIPLVDIPSPSDGHGWQVVDGQLEPLWFDGDFVPQVVAEYAHDDSSEDLSDTEDQVDDFFQADAFDDSDDE